VCIAPKTPAQGSAVERIWHLFDSQRQNLALAFRAFDHCRREMQRLVLGVIQGYLEQGIQTPMVHWNDLDDLVDSDQYFFNK
jgi:hypothetical protein